MSSANSLSPNGSHPWCVVLNVVIYDNITHSPGPAWGETWEDDCRLTLTISSTWNKKDLKL